MRLPWWQQGWPRGLRTENKTIRCCLCRAVYLRVICIRQRLDEVVSIALMFSDVVVQTLHYGLVVSFYVAVGLRMVQTGYQLIDFKEAAYICEELVY